MPSHIDIVSELPAEKEEHIERETLWPIIAHEFRTPITVIQGLSEWLMSSSVQGHRFVSEQLRGHTARSRPPNADVARVVHLMGVRWGSLRESWDLAPLVRGEMDSANQWRIHLRFDYQGEQTLPIWGDYRARDAFGQCQSVFFRREHFSGHRDATCRRRAHYGL